MTLKTLIASAAFACLVTASVSANIVITEMVSKSDQTADWFELTNFGTTPVDITGWQFDDVSAEITEAVPLTGVTSIAPGESVIFLEDSSDTAFRSFWGGLAGVQVGLLDSNAAGLGKNDGITIFDAADSIVAQQFYGDDDSHAGVWAGGMKWDSANFIGSGWVGGVAYDGQYGIHASAFVNSDGAYEYASPGTAVPEPASLVLAGLGGLCMLIRRG